MYPALGAGLTARGKPPSALTGKGVLAGPCPCPLLQPPAEFTANLHHCLTELLSLGSETRAARLHAPDSHILVHRTPAGRVLEGQIAPTKTEAAGALEGGLGPRAGPAGQQVSQCLSGACPKRHPAPSDSETTPLHLRQRAWGAARVGSARPHAIPSGRDPASRTERSAQAAHLGADPGMGCFCRLLLRHPLTAVGRQAPARRVQGLRANRDLGEPRRRKCGYGRVGPSQARCARSGGWGVWGV